MKKVFYRIFQGIMALVGRIFYKIDPIVISGNKSHLRITEICKKEKVKKLLIVTTQGTYKRETLKELFEKLKAEGFEYALFLEVTPDPTIECIEKGFKVYKEEHCDAIAAIGGGSVIDCAKVIAARAARPNKSVQKMRGVMKVLSKLPTFIAVPTTAGTGSETTVAAVVTDTIDGKHYKYAIEDLCLVPKYAVLDAGLTVSVPQKITAATGMDALTHAVEAYTNRFASKDVKNNSLLAVSLIFDNLYKAYEDGSNIEARENMLFGSFYAGIAFTKNYVGYVHALAHAVGALYGISHGEANAIILPVVMKSFGKASQKELAKLSRVAGITGSSDKECADRFIEAIFEMNEKMGLPKKISSLQKSDFNEIIKRAIKEANPLYPVPKIYGEKELRDLLNELLEDSK